MVPSTLLAIAQASTELVNRFCAGHNLNSILYTFKEYTQGTGSHMAMPSPEQDGLTTGRCSWNHRTPRKSCTRLDLKLHGPVQKASGWAEDNDLQTLMQYSSMSCKWNSVPTLHAATVLPVSHRMLLNRRSPSPPVAEISG